MQALFVSSVEFEYVVTLRQAYIFSKDFSKDFYQSLENIFPFHIEDSVYSLLIKATSDNLWEVPKDGKACLNYEVRILKKCLLPYIPTHQIWSCEGALHPNLEGW